MAKKKKDNYQETTDAATGSFTKGLVRDFDENFDPESSWPYARNAANNSKEGDLGVLGNEPSNYLCASAPYTIIGRVNIIKQYWVIFSTDDVNSEIGLLDESQCTYRTIVNDPCLNFSTLNLITGVSKENFDCNWGIYFADGKNVDRFINIGDMSLWPTVPYVGNNYYQNNVLWPGVQWVKDCTPDPQIGGVCTICTDTNVLDCDRIRINALVDTPCITLSQGANGGNIPNGSYIAFVAYNLNGQRYGDYFSPSNVQYVFNHNTIGGALEVVISNLETSSFTEFELVISSTINEATVARRIGIYSTAPSVTVYLDNIDDSLITVPLEFLKIRTPLYDTSDSIYETSNYLLKVGPRTTFDFNYQPLANQIHAQWAAVRYPADYYKNGGYVTGYMRDEVYAFWIRWIYSTGEKSKSYHIPGRAETSVGAETNNAPFAIYTDPNEAPERLFEAVNTASLSPPGLLPSNTSTEDGGDLIALGDMGYWESSELYPDKKPEIWNASYDSALSGTIDPRYDLCNKPIRHHKMPEDIIGTNSSYTRATVLGSGNASAVYINIIGVQFSNIKPPVYKDENGNVKVIPGIVGYEILRGSRQGNKSVVAKGIINNMRSYAVPGGGTGLYQNYPYNPVTNVYGNVLDPSLSYTAVGADGSNYSRVTANNINKDFFTFHSPDTSFYRPFLSTKELRLYTELGATNNVTGRFQEVPGHPKHKLLTDFALILSFVVGVAEAAAAMKGKVSVSADAPRILNIGLNGIFVNGTTTGAISAPSLAGPLSAATAGTQGTSNTAADGLVEAADVENGGGTGPQAVNQFYDAYGPGESLMRGFIGRGKTYTQEEGTLRSVLGLGLVAGVATFTNLTNTATQNNIELIYSFIKYRQYVLQYVSHGILHKDNVGAIALGNKRRLINDAGYLSNQYNTFVNNTINNLYRSSSVIINIDTVTLGGFANPFLPDTSMNTVGKNVSGGVLNWNSTTNPVNWSRPFNTFKSTASCYYTGLKLRFRNQYGQLESVEQVPVNCRQIVNSNNSIPDTAIFYNSTTDTTTFNTLYTSSILFGGDIYIGRYTEKNTFFYFSDWLYGEPDGTEFDYKLRYLGLYPRYYATFESYEFTGFLSSVLGNLAQPNQWNTPANLNNLDEKNPDPIFSNTTVLSFSKKNAYMYLFQSGVRDFYVESELNVAQRDWGEIDEQKHYEVLSNLNELFHTRIIKSGNYYKLNPSVSLSRLFYNVTSWGNMQDRTYNPAVAELCYRYLPNRVIYSLPSTLEGAKDYWRVFLPNNYKDYRSELTAIRPTGKNGAIIFFKNDSPIQIQGTETFDSEIGTKITIGSGELFNQPTQSLVNTDSSFEYGSCLDKFSIMNTPTGVYWMSQAQGKVFTLASSGLEEISGEGMRWWFSKFLPFRLLVDFPDFEVTDNPVVGIGTQSVYDNDFIVAYFSKKDYELRKDLPKGTVVTYIGGIDFTINNGRTIKLGDPKYFNDVSWTISFDPKNKMWISFHDWHPNLTILSNLNFLSVKGNSMWRHNDSTSSYCNYYGIDYPFQVEYVIDTGQTVNTLRNLEYILESYVYDVDGIDRFQLLDFNFDELIIHNTEQVSGLLNLIQVPKDNPFGRLNYPKVNPNSIDISFEKVEQKFRINQFWDITANRGEYNTNIQRPIWLTDWNGYNRILNPINLNYNKSVFERKKFRHYYTNVLFTKNVSGNAKMLMKLSNNKNLISPR